MHISFANSTALLVLVLLRRFLLVSAFELGDLPQALSHLPLRPHVVHFAGVVHLGHHDVDQPAALRHV